MLLCTCTKKKKKKKNFRRSKIYENDESDHIFVSTRTFLFHRNITISEMHAYFCINIKFSYAIVVRKGDVVL